MELIKKNIVLILVVVVVIIFFVWLAIREPQSNTALLQSEETGQLTQSEEDLLRLLVDMRSIRLDASLFEDPVFQSLQDFGRQIIPEPVGRENPFLPRGAEIQVDRTETTTITDPNTANAFGSTIQR